jgi:hypothetical protein
MQWGDIGRIDLAQDRYRQLALVKAVITLRVPDDAGSFMTISGIFSF